MYTFTICRTDLQSQFLRFAMIVLNYKATFYAQYLGTFVIRLHKSCEKPGTVPVVELLFVIRRKVKKTLRNAAILFNLLLASFFSTCKPWPLPRLVPIHDSSSPSSLSLSTVWHSSHLPVTSSWAFITSFYLAACLQIFLSPPQARTQNYLFGRGGGRGKGADPGAIYNLCLILKTSTCPFSIYVWF